MSSCPDVTVIVPVRNGARYLEVAVRSILNQGGVAIELVVVDDGSTDATASLLADLAAQRREVSVLWTAGVGVARALNSGLERARAPLIARMDADDLATPGRLARQAAYLAANSHIGVLGTQARFINAEGRLAGRYRVPVGIERVGRALETSSPIVHPSVMMRRQVVEAVGGYRPEFEGAEDYDLWLRLSMLTYLDNLPHIGLFYRRHASQVSKTSSFRQAERASLALVSHDCVGRNEIDPFAGISNINHWRTALRGSRPDAIPLVRALTATRLADNGGTVSPRGTRYYRLASTGAILPRRRMAVAALHHYRHLWRAGNTRVALVEFGKDLLRWRLALLRACWHQLATAWHSRTPAATAIRLPIVTRNRRDAPSRSIIAIHQSPSSIPQHRRSGL